MTSSRLTREQVLSRLAVLDLGSGDLAATLGEIAHLAVQALPGAAEVSVTLIRDDRPMTPASTGAVAVELDERQYELGHGPCLDAAQSGATLVITDMATETRWPDYTPRALAAGVRSSLSVSLPVPHDVTGALNVYGTAVNAFDYDTQQLAMWLADHAAAAIANATRYADAAALAQQLREAMASRAVIEQAKGMLMLLRRCDEETAFAHLIRASQHSQRKLRDVARELVERARTDFEDAAVPVG